MRFVSIVRFKITASALMDSKSFNSSSVMEITWSRSNINLLGRNSSTFTKGEAVVLDLGELVNGAKSVRCLWELLEPD